MTDSRIGWLIGGLAASLLGASALFFARIAGFELLLPLIALGGVSLTAALWMLRRSPLPTFPAVAVVSAAAGVGILWLSSIGWGLIGVAAALLVVWMVGRTPSAR